MRLRGVGGGSSHIAHTVLVSQCMPCLQMAHAPSFPVAETIQNSDLRDNNAFGQNARENRIFGSRILFSRVAIPVVK